MENLCPCGSGMPYTVCCEPVIAERRQVKTAEALLRARYTAYVMRTIDFIFKNIDPLKYPKTKTSVEATRELSEGSTWNGLKIINAQKGSAGDDEGIIEFESYYRRNGIDYIQHEIAVFGKLDGKWIYRDGTIRIMPAKKKKHGRNEPCPCGSGKKYKNCCGR
jgi:SEC-C motif-containing protein